MKPIFEIGVRPPPSIFGVLPSINRLPLPLAPYAGILNLYSGESILLLVSSELFLTSETALDTFIASYILSSMPALIIGLPISSVSFDPISVKTDRLFGFLMTTVSSAVVASLALDSV